MSLPESPSKFSADRNTRIERLFPGLVSVTRVEKGRPAVEFENDVVTAVAESMDQHPCNVRIIVPRLIFRG